MRPDTDRNPSISSGISGKTITPGVIRIVLPYAAFAGLWILVSDRLTGLFISDPHILVCVSTIKGWIFVAVTSVLLLFLVRSWSRQLLREANARIDQAHTIDALEERFRVVLEQAGDAIWLARPDKRLTFANPAACRLTGHSLEELLEMPFTDLLSDEELENLPAQLELLAREPFNRREWTLRRRDGSLVSVELTTQRMANGGYLGLGRDLTEKKRTEVERGLTVEFLRLVNENGNKKDMIREAVTFFQQQSGCEAVGIRLEEGDDYPYFEARGFPGKFVLMENSLCARDKEGRLVRDNRGNVLIECMCGNVISGRFDPSKPFFTPLGSFWTNSTTELLSTTTDADRQTRTRNRCHGEGYESVALIGLRVGEKRLGLLQLNDRQQGRFSTEIIALWERLAGYLAVAIAKFQAEEELRASEELYRSLFDNMLNGFAYCRMLFEEGQPRDFIYLSVNEAFVTLTGLKDVVGKKVTEVIPGIREADPALFEIYGRVSLTGKPERFEMYVEALKDWYWISVYSPRKEHFVAIFDVITEQKKLEAQLRHAQKMEAIGTLAGGIAHDFNNILNVIIGFGDLLNTHIKDDDPLQMYVKEILESANRATALTHSLLAFSRKQIISVKPVEVNDLIRRVEKFLKRIIGEDISVQTVLGEDKMTVMADSGQIEQVLMNLATNARDAMPQGGTLTLEAGRVELDESFVTKHGYGKPGVYALLTATDTGEGMDEETKRRIFEPFFTTKELGRGTGLGLSLAYGIVKQHDGYIDVYSAPGRGSSFKVYLPLVNLSEETEVLQSVAASVPSGGTETILLAEDDAALRKLIRIVLETAGYTLITADNGEDAVQRFIEHKDEVKLVILDMIMPGKNGREAYEEIRKIRPDIKAVLVSGYTADKVQREGLLAAGLELLLKPVSPRDLLKKVREVLDA